MTEEAIDAHLHDLALQEETLLNHGIVGDQGFRPSSGP